jgi:hypothetical protein
VRGGWRAEFAPRLLHLPGMPPEPITSLTLEPHLAAAGAPAATFARLWRSLWAQPYLSAELLECCRLTLARLHRDPLESAAANPYAPLPSAGAARRAAVLAGRAHDSPLFSAGERAILDFAESYGLDPQSLTDTQATAVKQQLGESGLVFLIEALGCLDARIRSARVLRDLFHHGSRPDE